MSVISVYAVLADAEEAERIGRAMIEERLAACVNLLGPVRSIYRWKGEVEIATEVAAIFKTKAWLVPHTLLFNDPPVHGRYRRLALEALSMKAVKGLQPFVEKNVARFAQQFDAGDPVDYVANFCERVPLSTILQFAIQSAVQRKCFQWGSAPLESMVPE